MSIRIGLALVLGIGFGLAQTARADSLRCGSGLVRDGDTRARVLELCGEPIDVQNRSILRRAQYRDKVTGRVVYFGPSHVEVPVEIWTYNFGPSKLMRRIRIVDGFVTEIDTLGYGHH